MLGFISQRHSVLWQCEAAKGDKLGQFCRTTGRYDRFANRGRWTGQLLQRFANGKLTDCEQVCNDPPDPASGIGVWIVECQGLEVMSVASPALPALQHSH